jgi:hypothetical protein
MYIHKIVKYYVVGTYIRKIIKHLCMCVLMHAYAFVGHSKRNFHYFSAVYFKKNKGQGSVLLLVLDKLIVLAITLSFCLYAWCNSMTRISIDSPIRISLYKRG